MRCTLIVLDSLGVGAMPDAADWGDAGADTLGHILSTVKDIQLKARVDTEVEIEYLKNGGVLHYVLRNLARS